VRILFMGTPEFAAVNLQALIDRKLEIIGAVTQPDRPGGRGMAIQPSAVKRIALQHQLAIWQPEKVASAEFIALFRSLRPELVVVVAFGQKIPAPILFEPQYGCINVHGSLLPRYRGAAPIQWAILNGDARAGVTTMYMDEGWDTGDVIYQAATGVPPDENFGSLYRRLAGIGAELLVKTVIDIEAGKAPRIPQNSSEATVAPKLKPEWQEIRWNEPSRRIHNIVRVFAPSPGAETYCGSERLKIYETQISDVEPEASGQPGTILRILKKQGILVATADRPLIITRLQPAGKKPMAAIDFANGRRLACGMILGRNE
jgi:methionyl-tRNA formyltransferase